MVKNSFPEVPPHHRGKRSALTRALARWFLRVNGWRVSGSVPEHPRFIVVAGPHTSNWDFVYGLSAAVAMNLDIHWLGKNTLFKPPMGRLMHWLGGIPVDRSNPAGVAEQVAARIREAGDMALIITPEGTRSKVKKWKTGFLRIAQMSDSVLVVTCIDFGERVINVGEVFEAGEDACADIAYIQERFSQVRPRHPDEY